MRYDEQARFLVKPQKKAILCPRVLWCMTKKTIINSFCVQVPIGLKKIAGGRFPHRGPICLEKLFPGSFFASFTA
jgi:hypothetical protein